MFSQNWISVGDNINDCRTLDIKVHDDKLYANKCGLHVWDGFMWDELTSPYSSTCNSMITIEFYNDTLFRSGDWYDNGGPDYISHVCKWVDLEGTAFDGQWIQVGGDFNRDYWSSIKNLKTVDGYLYALGLFDEVGNIETENIARWNGQNWEGLGLGLNYTPWDVVKYKDDIIAAGTFTASGVDSTMSYIARWDGSEWHPLDSTIQFKHSMTSLIVYDSLLFFNYSDTLSNGLKIDGVGYWDGNNFYSAGNSLIRHVFSFHEFNEELYVAAKTNDADDSSTERVIIKWNGGNDWVQIGNSFDNLVWDIDDFQNELYAGGMFEMVGNNLVDGLSKFKSITTSNSEITENSTIEIYPNPTNNRIQFDVDAKGIAQITDLHGVEVWNSSIKNGNNEINLSSLESGIYFVIITTNGEEFVSKIIKQ